MKSWLYWALTILLLVFVLYEPIPFLFALVTLWFLWLLLNSINHFFISHQFQVHIVGEKQSEVGREGQLQIMIQHKSLFPLWASELQLEFSNQLTNEKIQQKMVLTLARKDQQKHFLRYNLTQCGQWKICAIDVMAKSIWGGSKSYPIKSQHEIIVYPKQFAIQLQKLSQAVSEGKVSTQHRVLSLETSERFGFRAYRKGDAIKQIHWKLSAKKDELIVSEHISEQQGVLQFYIEKSADATQYTTLLSLLFSLLSACVKENREVMISINHQQYNGSDMREIASALLRGGQCDRPKTGEFLAIVSNESVENGLILRLKEQASECQTAYDFTAESMESQFATLAC